MVKFRKADFGLILIAIITFIDIFLIFTPFISIDVNGISADLFTGDKLFEVSSASQAAAPIGMIFMVLMSVITFLFTIITLARRLLGYDDGSSVFNEVIIGIFSFIYALLAFLTVVMYFGQYNEGRPIPEGYVLGGGAIAIGCLELVCMIIAFITGYMIANYYDDYIGNNGRTYRPQYNYQNTYQAQSNNNYVNNSQPYSNSQNVNNIQDPIPGVNVSASNTNNAEESIDIDTFKETLLKLKKLVEEGLITEEDYNTKKEELLKKIK